MNRSRSFAVLFDKLSRIERQSRPKYKSAVPNWFIRRTLRTADFLNICAPSSPNSYNAGISNTPRFLVELHCIFARSFNEHPNSSSLRTLICNTLIEGHPHFLQNIFHDLSLLLEWFTPGFLPPIFLLYSILGQQLLFKRKHRSVVPIHGHV